MKVITIGEVLVEVMRKDLDEPLDRPGDFVGPFPSGAPAIFADAVSKLGAASGIVGGIGDDRFGQCLQKRLESDGVDLSCLKVVDELPTGDAFVSYFSDGSREFLFHMNNAAAGTIGKDDISKDYVRNADMLHINGSSLAMGADMRRACYEGVKIASEVGVKISFDPNLRTELLGIEETREICGPVLDSCDLLIPGSDELAGIIGGDSEKERAESAMSNGVELVAVKDGSKGCRMYSQAGTSTREALEVKEVDPTGAGDAFSAATAVGWLEGMEIGRLSLFANTVGAIVVRQKGPMEGLRSREWVDELVTDHEN